MARLIATLLCVVTVAGCGGETDRSACDDDAFRAQDEALYVAQATADNAARGGAPVAVLVTDLRAGAMALEAAVDAAAPCDEALVELGRRERDAVAGMRAAARQLEEGDTGQARSALGTIADELSDVQRKLQPGP